MPLNLFKAMTKLKQNKCSNKKMYVFFDTSSDSEQSGMLVDNSIFQKNKYICVCY